MRRWSESGLHWHSPLAILVVLLANGCAEEIANEQVGTASDSAAQTTRSGNRVISQQRVPQGSAGPRAASITKGDTVVIYLGQAGVDRDLERLEAGEEVPYIWQRITVGLDAFETGELIDLAVDGLARFEEKVQLFNCGPEGYSHVLAFDSGESGLSGELFTRAGGLGVDVSFSVEFFGEKSVPCNGTIQSFSSANEFFSTPSER